jgi:WXG100 family type VII secretion target
MINVPPVRPDIGRAIDAIGIRGTPGPISSVLSNILRQDFIKFDPEKIMEVSITLDRQHKRFTESTLSIKRRVDNLRSVWHGDSAAEYFEKMKELDRLSVEMSKRIIAFSQDLENASGIYKKGEADAKQEAERLPTEGVFLV